MQSKKLLLAKCANSVLQAEHKRLAEAPMRSVLEDIILIVEDMVLF